MEHAEQLIVIDGRLRWVFFGLECVLGVDLSQSEKERVFADMQTDHASAKQYMFWESGRFRVAGQVDEYEPETLFISLSGPGARDALQRVIDKAEHEYQRAQNDGS